MITEFRGIASACLVSSLLFAAPGAHAHIVLEQKSATAGSYHKATFMVGHGCDGSPTTGIEIEMPEPMAVVKPMPKPGWQLVTRTAPPAVPLSLHGQPVTEAVSRVIWKGGSLPDSQYDEFVLLLQLSKRSGPLYFKVMQSCETGRSDWVEIPADSQVAGESGRQGGRLKWPAPVLEVQPAVAPAHHH
jgi:uncharacterized protein YcnI